MEEERERESEEIELERMELEPESCRATVDVDDGQKMNKEAVAVKQNDHGGDESVEETREAVSQTKAPQIGDQRRYFKEVLPGVSQILNSGKALKPITTPRRESGNVIQLDYEDY